MTVPEWYWGQVTVEGLEKATKRLRTAKDTINDLAWASTDEGYEYWASVWDKLDDMADALDPDLR